MKNPIRYLSAVYLKINKDIDKEVLDRKLIGTIEMHHHYDHRGIFWVSTLD